MAAQSQISAFISAETRSLLEQYAEAHGIKKAHLVEEALLHHLKALSELPADIVIPPRILLTQKGADAVMARIRKPQRPTRAMRELFGK